MSTNTHHNPPRVAITGSTGLIGSAVVAELQAVGWRVDRLVRRDPRPGTNEIRWQPQGNEIDVTSLAGVDAVINLAGEPIAAGRWNDERKRAIHDSRVVGTLLLAQTMAQLDPPPRVFVSASAIGYYGDRGDEPMTEDSPPGDGFLADVCQAWEAAAEPARAAGIRVVHPRIGVVLSPDGGALAKMLGPFKAGVGGKVGNGRQYMSWITLADIARVLVRAVEDDSLRGPLNAVAPHPVTNAEFTRALGEVLGRPTVLPLPAMMVKLTFGEMGRELLLASTRAIPTRLQSTSFEFVHVDVEAGLRAVLSESN